MATEGSLSDIRSQCEESSVVDATGDDHLPQANDSQNVFVFTSDVLVINRLVPLDVNNVDSLQRWAHHQSPVARIL